MQTEAHSSPQSRLEKRARSLTHSGPISSVLELLGAFPRWGLQEREGQNIAHSVRLSLIQYQASSSSHLPEVQDFLTKLGLPLSSHCLPYKCSLYPHIHQHGLLPPLFGPSGLAVPSPHTVSQTPELTGDRQSPKLEQALTATLVQSQCPQSSPKVSNPDSSAETPGRTEPSWRPSMALLPDQE